MTRATQQEHQSAGDEATSLHCTASASSLISSQLRFVKSKHTREKQPELAK